MRREKRSPLWISYINPSIRPEVSRHFHLSRRNGNNPIANSVGQFEILMVVVIVRQSCNFIHNVQPILFVPKELSRFALGNLAQSGFTLVSERGMTYVVAYCDCLGKFGV
jgi:hypothetical protein